MADWLDGYFENKPIVDATVNPADGGVVVEDGTVTNAKLAAAAANTIKSNPTDGSLAPTDMTVAINTLVGRGPTGNIDDLAVQAGLTITDTTIGRPAFTGDVTASANGNVLTIANDAVTTAKILDANVTTAKIALNAVGNQRMAQMATKTVKGNATGSTANSQDMTISGGLYTDDTSILKSRGSWGLRYIFDTQTTTTDPTAGKCNFNAANTQLIISSTDADGRDIDDYLATVLNGQIKFMSNNTVSNAPWGLFTITGSAADNTGFRTITGVRVASVGSTPADGEEIIIVYDAIATAADVVASNVASNVVTHNAQNELLDSAGEVISGTSAVTNYTALVALDTTTYADFAIKVNNGLNSSVWTPNGANWLPLNGIYLQARSNVATAAITCANAVTWAATDSGVSNGAGGTYTKLTGTAHGLTSASVGSSLVQTNAPTNWPAAGTLHNIVSVIDADNITITTPWVASMGVPVFNTTSQYGIVLQLTIPVLRANTRYIFESTFKGGLVASSPKVKTTLGISTGTTVLQTWTATTTASNSALPFRVGFKNRNSVSSQESLYGSTSSGFASGGTLATATLDLSLGTEVFQVELQANTVDTPVSLAGYTVRIEG